MHRKLVLALDPSTPPSEAVETAEEDWGRDSEGEEGLDKERFCWCWFELADVWTETMEAAEYETFLTRTMSMITTTDKSGRVMWRDDKEVTRLRVRANPDPDPNPNPNPNPKPYRPRSCVSASS